ncbi:hypothetical protein TSTA_084110 [Talaromyces stipitatus ATCC 10500]|uniref:Uncharacterized protein n=1 Tax=Talaromyces stipitatus (strain ATCC 10500 / CBS 375.48 / QM 6759 / NRRL 1006) TaxID=441959 RepID=B8M082_TALSN|nr:uncharacterized protein TSTA_084110 [Talaromyces stipitatus ATCC 10500]XP_002478143.1 uncharacterized protein TSTA_084110 [Talaromyces stipitatus ATCC 10500]EED21179.1 hypothetical protein TSTA_084110 [Talaromyces stipitatus ATCC 10500]EED21180.1 hypothetical protein TSTA_084110 [Talaromyces stipitatus ATCC 10500]
MKVTLFALSLLSAIGLAAASPVAEIDLAERKACTYGIGEIFENVSCGVVEANPCVDPFTGKCDYPLGCMCVDDSTCCYGLAYVTQILHTPTGTNCLMACAAYIIPP